MFCIKTLPCRGGISAINICFFETLNLQTSPMRTATAYNATLGDIVLTKMIATTIKTMKQTDPFRRLNRNNLILTTGVQLLYKTNKQITRELVGYRMGPS